MKITKFGVLVNKTTSLFTSIRDTNISRGRAKSLETPEWGGGVNFVGRFWKIQRERGVIRQIPSVGVVWIFSGTTQWDINQGSTVYMTGWLHELENPKISLLFLGSIGIIENLIILLLSVISHIKVVHLLLLLFWILFFTLFGKTLDDENKYGRPRDWMKET